MTRLKKLFLVNNKINKIENLSSLRQLQMLELGSNRIRVGAAPWRPVPSRGRPCLGRVGAGCAWLGFSREEAPPRGQC